MNYDKMRKAIDDFFDSPESENYFKEMAIKDEIQQNRFVRFGKYLESHKFSDLIDLLILEHDKEYENSCYDKGFEPFPNNKLQFLLDYVKENGILSHRIEIDVDFPNEIYEYDDYYFQTIYGQGSFIRIYDKNNLKLILQL